MGQRGRAVEAARWFVIWAVFTVFMCIVTSLMHIYEGWWHTAVTAAAVVAAWYLFPRLRARKMHRTSTRESGGEPEAP